MKAAQAEEALGRVINIGSGREVAIGELAQRVVAAIAGSGPVVHDEMRLRPGRSEVNRLVADNRLAKELLAWEPQVGLDEGIRRTTAWIMAHFERYEQGKYQI